MENAYLSHYGIMGQKWGERHYQTSDGSWTEEGLARRRQEGTKADQKEARNAQRWLNKSDKLLAQKRYNKFEIEQKTKRYQDKIKQQENAGKTEKAERTKTKLEKYTKKASARYDNALEDTEKGKQEVEKLISELKDQNFTVAVRDARRAVKETDDIWKSAVGTAGSIAAATAMQLPFYMITRYQTYAPGTEYKVQTGELTEKQKKRGWRSLNDASASKTEDPIEKDNNTAKLTDYKSSKTASTASRKSAKTKNASNKATDDEGYTWTDRIRRDKTQLYEKAKEKDIWNMEFMEMVDDQLLDDPKKLLKEYGEFLNDPDEWMERN